MQLRVSPCACCLELHEQLRRLLPPGVALPRQERPNARLAEPVRVRGAGIPLEERERDLTVQIAEQAERPGPEPLELGPQLVDQRRPGTDQILPPAGQRPDRLRGIRIGLQHPEAMMIGPRQLAQNERVKPIGLAARHAEPVTGRRHLVGVQRQHPQARVQEPLDHQPVRPLHRDQLHPQPHQRPAQRPQPPLVMRERSREQLLARRIRDEHIMLLRRPIDASVTSIHL